jgi:hypothetical protein
LAQNVDFEAISRELKANVSLGVCIHTQREKNSNKKIRFTPNNVYAVIAFKEDS